MAGDTRPPQQIPEEDRDYYLERRYPSFGNLVPRDVASRAAKAVCDEGRGVGETRLAVYLDFADAIKRVGVDVVRQRYGNLFQMYEKITDEDPYKVPMRIYPAVHYTMGGLWVDYNLMSTVPGLHVLGRGQLLGPRRQPARRERADAGARRRLLRHPLHDRPLPRQPAAARRSTSITTAFGEAQQATQARIDRLLAVKGQKTARELHREVGRVLWDYVGMSRTAEAGLKHRARSHPEAARRVLAERLGPRRAEQREQEPRVRRPRRRLPRVRARRWRSTRSSAASRAAGTSARSTRRRTARRCATTNSFTPRGGLGVPRRGRHGRCATRSR